MKFLAKIRNILQKVLGLHFQKTDFFVHIVLKIIFIVNEIQY